jgi:hypothetical protein
MKLDDVTISRLIIESYTRNLNGDVINGDVHH